MISIIAAISENNVIGEKNTLPWNIPEDLKHFRTITYKHPVIMGRKTYESIGRPLPNRPNIIVTRDKSYNVKGCIVTHSIEDAIGKGKKHLLDYSSSEHERIEKLPLRKFSTSSNNKIKEIFIIGGSEIYRQAIPIADKLYLTLIRKKFSGDAYFPDYSRFNKVIKKEDLKSGNIDLTFLELVPEK